jgi:hypothetical protein
MSTSVPLAAPGQAVALPVDLYDANFDARQLAPEQVQQLQRNELKSFNPVLALVLSVLTIGIFPAFYYAAKHGRLPKVMPNDYGAGKAIGFMFIPYFNIYWHFVMWPRLVDRINFQYRLRGQADPINRKLVIWTLILMLVGVGYLLAPVVVWQGQNAINGLAAEHEA